MRLNRLLVLTLLLLIPAGPTACRDASNDAGVDSDRPITVAVTNYPLRFFVERIAGDLVEVEWLVPDGVNPADWRPSADDVATMGDADLVLLNGAGYEPWMETASLPSRILVDTSAGFKDRFIETDDRVHAHGPDGSHSHAGVASHTWLDPDLAMLQGQAVLQALAELIPAEQDTMRSNFGVLRRQLLERSANMEQAINGRPETEVVFSHPVYQYLQRRFRMDGESVHFEPDRRPDDAAIEELDSTLASRPAEWFIWEGTPSDGNRDLIEARGMQDVVLDPGGARPAEGDLLDILDANVAALRTVYGYSDDS
ncbi:MAG: zinc ABC transporter substrate-binding protein [Phycisphaera sp.]|nr:zinc ABC transporter substrate-binding protein [Phycisphaera sp.]